MPKANQPVTQHKQAKLIWKIASCLLFIAVPLLAPLYLKHQVSTDSGCVITSNYVVEVLILAIPGLLYLATKWLLRRRVFLPWRLKVSGIEYILPGLAASIVLLGLMYIMGVSLGLQTLGGCPSSPGPNYPYPINDTSNGGGV